MTPAEIRDLKVGSWLTFTPTIWSTPIEGVVRTDGPDGLLIEWDDGHRAPIKPDQLHSSKFQPLEIK
jgi:hypothetical protein